MTASSAALAETPARELKPTDLTVVRLFLLCLGIILIGYALLGRGFAHLGVPPVYLGEFVLALGLAATAWAALRSRLQISRSSLLVVLVVFMALGLIRTVPYLPTNGTDALRDGSLWGYGIFAIILFVLLDRDWVLKLFKLYGYFAIAFLFLAPVAYVLFVNFTVQSTPGSFVYVNSLIPNAPGSSIPILFFKAQDMAVQTAGAITFLVLATPLWRRVRDFLWRFAAAVPASFMVYTTGTVTRGGLAAVAAAMALLGLVAGRTRNWLPLFAGAVLFTAIVMSGVSLPSSSAGPTPTPAQPTPIPSASLSASAIPTPIPTPVPTPTPACDADWCRTRPPTPSQWWENIISIFFNSTNSQLQGTKQFRLAWYGAIMDYTFHGPYFWDGKGFGINLADSDGFQGTPDHSLREVPNSHLAVLARMGVPGFALWILLQGAFALLLLRALVLFRRAGDKQLATVTAWVGIFWTAIMVNSFFDPYIESPQGGIWFWSLFGVGLVLMRLVPRRQAE